MLKRALIVFLFFNISLHLIAQNTVNLCLGDSHNFAVSQHIGSTYNWNVDNNYATIMSGNGTESIILNLDSIGIFKLYVEEFHISSCIGYDSIMIEVHEIPSPIISANGSIHICEGQDVELSLENSASFHSYLWNNGSSNSNLIINSSGQYFLEVSDMNGCSKISNVIEVIVEPEIIADFSIEGLCLNHPTIFKNTSFSSGSVINYFRWKLENNYFLGDSVSYEYNLQGDYEAELLLENEFGCQNSIIKSFKIYNNPVADFRHTPFIISTSNPEIKLINLSENISSSLWRFNDSIYSSFNSPTLVFDNPGFHNIILIVEDTNQCTDSILKNIKVNYDFVLHIPNSFTPNSDGYNDIFKPEGLRMERYISYQFSIYNKWGSKVFETNDINLGWDGRDFLSGSYNWILYINDELGKIRKKVGSVLLIR